MSRAQAPPRGVKKRPNAANKVPGADVQPQAVFVKFPDWVPCVVFAPDNKTLAAGSYGVIKLLDVVEHQEVAALPEPAGFVKAVAFSADGKRMAWGCEGGRIQICEAATGKPQLEVRPSPGNYFTAWAIRGGVFPGRMQSDRLVLAARDKIPPTSVPRRTEADGIRRVSSCASGGDAC